ncbi:MAG: hypothetical protein ACK4UR_01525 [Caldimicrobium sp.]
MYWYLIGIFLWLQVLNVYAADTLIIEEPEIYPKKEFAYLQKPIWKFLKEKLSPLKETPYNKEDIKVLESVFNFDLSGKAQIELRIKRQSTNEILYERTSLCTFENFWITLESLTKEIKEKFEYKEMAIPPKEQLGELIKELPQKENSKSTKITYYSTRDKSSLFSKINPFRKISQFFSKKEDTLKIKIEVTPPPPPPPDSIYNREVSKNIMVPSTISVEEKKTPSVPSENTLQDYDKKNSTWQWY